MDLALNKTGCSGSEARFWNENYVIYSRLKWRTSVAEEKQLSQAQTHSVVYPGQLVNKSTLALKYKSESTIFPSAHVEWYYHEKGRIQRHSHKEIDCCARFSINFLARLMKINDYGQSLREQCIYKYLE